MPSRKMMVENSQLGVLRSGLMVALKSISPKKNMMTMAISDGWNKTKAGLGQKKPGKVAAQNRHDAVAEIKYVNNAVNDGQPQSHGGIKGTRYKTAYQCIDNIPDGTPPGCGLKLLFFMI